MSSVARVFMVIDHLAREGAMGVRGLSKALDLPLGSTHRLLADLATEAVIEQTTGGNWQLSYRLLEITDLQIDHVGFPRLARPYCDALARFSGETVNVNILSNLSCVCIDKVRGNESMQLDWRVGARGPLHCGDIILDKPHRQILIGASVGRHHFFGGSAGGLALAIFLSAAASLASSSSHSRARAASLNLSSCVFEGLLTPAHLIH